MLLNYLHLVECFYNIYPVCMRAFIEKTCLKPLWNPGILHLPFFRTICIFYCFPFRVPRKSVSNSPNNAISGAVVCDDDGDGGSDDDDDDDDDDDSLEQ